MHWVVLAAALQFGLAAVLLLKCTRRPTPPAEVASYREPERPRALVVITPGLLLSAAGATLVGLTGLWPLGWAVMVAIVGAHEPWAHALRPHAILSATAGVGLLATAAIALRRLRDPEPERASDEGLASAALVLGFLGELAVVCAGRAPSAWWTMRLEQLPAFALPLAWMLAGAMLLATSRAAGGTRRVG